MSLDKTGLGKRGLDNGFLYQKIHHHLARGEELILVTLIAARGSTPRKEGSRMLVLKGEQTEGTIGGGVLEAAVVRQARECLAEGRSSIRSFNLASQAPGGLPMECGGRVEVLLEYMAPESELIGLVSQAARLETEEIEFTMIANIEENGTGERKVVRDLVVNEKLADVWKQAMNRENLVAEKAPVILSEDRQQLIERMLPRDTLFIFGAGHVGSETALLASHAGFRVRIIDDRENAAGLPDFMHLGIDTTIIPEFQGISERLHLNARSYALIVTRGHLYDQRVLEQVLPLNLCYTGMIGSQKKKSAIYSSLLEKGFGQEDLDRVYCPVGLEIGAETPAELAVSIVAQLIQVKASRKNGA